MIKKVDPQPNEKKYPNPKSKLSRKSAFEGNTNKTSTKLVNIYNYNEINSGLVI